MDERQHRQRVDFRTAREADLGAILALIADDAVASARGGDTGQVDAPTRRAFDAIAADPNNQLIVGERGDEVVAVLQLTVIPGLSRGGLTRALVESVRVRDDLRGLGVGAALMQHAMVLARQAGCGLMQLTTDKRRHRAHDFYRRLGFDASHEGMKRTL